MHANKFSDFYDNLDKKTKKEIHKLYRTTQPTLGQKKQIYSFYLAAQDLETVKIFIKDILKDEYIIKERENDFENRVDFSYKEGILEDCLEKLGETKSYMFLLFVYGAIYKLKQGLKRGQMVDLNSFADVLFTSIHSYDKGVYTSNKLVNTIKGFYKLI
ncbi:DUF643 domain-containing protein (plasmid) [Borreliella japonica]|uniref:DUF643 domain-containing protein n=1 Tax=Borreliella japonica TaxID=34095 RepID=UPI003AB1A841